MFEHYEPSEEEWNTMKAKEVILMLTFASEIKDCLELFRNRKNISLFEIAGKFPGACILLIRNRCLDFSDEETFALKVSKYGERYFTMDTERNNQKDELIRAGLSSNEVDLIQKENSKKNTEELLKKMFSGVKKDDSK